MCIRGSPKLVPQFLGQVIFEKGTKGNYDIVVPTCFHKNTYKLLGCARKMILPQNSITKHDPLDLPIHASSRWDHPNFYTHVRIRDMIPIRPQKLEVVVRQQPPLCNTGRALTCRAFRRSTMLAAAGYCGKALNMM